MRTELTELAFPGLLLAVFLLCSSGLAGKPPQNQLGIVVSNPRQEEGDSGSSACRFSVSIPFTAPEDGLELQWETKDGSARAEDGDYESGKGTLRFSEGQRKAGLEIKINGDAIREDDETVFLRCWPAELGKGDKKEHIATGTGTIVNDDNRFELILTPVTDFEGHRLTTDFSFLATLNARVPLGDPISIPWKTVSHTADADDFRPANGVLVFRPGDRYKTIDVVVYHDDRYEPIDETFHVQLDLPNNVTGDRTVEGTIKDDFQGGDSSGFAGYFVDAKTGADSNPGTVLAPFLTIARGVKALKAGDTLYLREGRYFAVDLDVGKLQGTAAKPIHIRAFPGERVVVAATRDLGTDGWVPVDRDDVNYGKYFGKTAGAAAIGKIYKKKIGFGISRLYVDGREVGMGRWPDAPAWSDLSWNRWQSRRGVAGTAREGR